MKKGENGILRRLVRRLKSSRGSAYFEFCVFVPVILLTFLFAADFTRILYAEQQVEIATRILCDIECHLRPGARDRDKQVGSGCPGSPGKKVVRTYLAEALEKEGIFKRAGSGENSVYCKGSFYNQSGVLHTIINDVLGKITHPEEIKNIFVRILGRIFGGFLNLVTLKTFNYVTDVVATDKVVRTSASVLICPFSPGSPYTLFGKHDSEGVMLIPAAASRLGGGAAAYNRPLLTDQRVRYHCHMPSLETLPLAPYTYVRALSNVFGNWIKDK